MVHYYPYQDKKFEYILIESSKQVSIFAPTKNLLFLHGINDCVQNHLEILTHLSEAGYNVYALNLPMHGNSDELQNLSWEDLSQFMMEFIKDHNLVNLTIVGYSLGGAIVLKSLANLMTVDKIVLISPYCHPINYFSPKFLLNSVKFVFRNYFELFFNKYNKPAPYVKNTLKIFRIYMPLFNRNITFDIADFNKKINVIILGKDEMIDAKKVENCFKDHSNVSISILDSFTHNLYYISDNQAKVLVNLMLA